MILLINFAVITIPISISARHYIKAVLFTIVTSLVISSDKMFKTIIRIFHKTKGALLQSIVPAPNQMISGKAKISVTEIVNPRVELIVDFYDAEGRWLSNAVASTARPTPGDINF